MQQLMNQLQAGLLAAVEKSALAVRRQIDENPSSPENHRHAFACMTSLLDHLNEPQRAAVTLPAEHALILAGAGSGKTRVLTTRIAWLISNGLARPQNILAVTFTNKAAKEMQTRLAAMLPVNVKSMWIGTFHGLCNRLLRAHYQDAGLPQTFQILDSADQLSAVKRLMKAMNVDDEKFPPREICQYINAQKEQGLRASAVEAWDSWAKQKVEIYSAYEGQCQREGVVDFAELLLRSYELLSRNELLLRHYQERFSHILVDEFQDTNKLQYRWLKLLAGQHAALFCVGDDDQSIYAFRGADVGNMRDFEREFKVRHMIRLEQNYRSHGNILDAANAIIRNNPQRLGKNLWTQAGTGEPIRVYEAYSDSDEARWIVEEIKSLVRDGHMRAEIALLYRSNAQSRALEHALFNAGLPYRVYGGLRFFDRAEVKHALAYLRLIANPSDDTAFLRVVNFPVRGIGARSIESLQDAARQSGRSLYQSVGAVAGKAGAKLQAVVRLVDGLRAATQGLTLGEIIDHMLHASGLLDFYRADKDGQDRVENLEELVNAAESFVTQEGFGRDAVALPVDEQGTPPVDTGGAPLTPDADTGEIMSPLAAFLTHASLEAGDNQAQAGADAIQLMTVHSAKGLEFDAVFITGIEEGLFPHEQSLSDADGVEEERRLMYVAITRARQRLYLSFSQTRMLHGQTRYNVPSRFFQELPEPLLSRVNHVRQAPGYGHARQQSPSYGAARGAARTVSASPSSVPRDFPWRIGQAVNYAKFGAGVIVSAEGGGADARVQVNFRDSGLKWLMLEYAKLTAV